MQTIKIQDIDETAKLSMSRSSAYILPELQRAKAKEDTKVTLEKCLDETMSICFNFSAISIITPICLSLNLGLTTGGPVVMFWGYLIASFFSVCTAAALAEICSVHPAVGSVYYWAAALTPNPRWTPAVSYICGWFNLLGCIAFDSSTA